MVRAVGIEPTLQRNGILNPARLPIPPRPHTNNTHDDEVLEPSIDLDLCVNRFGHKAALNLLDVRKAYEG